MTSDRLANIRAASPFNAGKRARIPKRPAGLPKTRQKPEEDLHVRAVVHLRRILPADALVFHVPNERKGDDAQAALQRIRFSRMGVMAGIADLLIVWRGKLHCIELKAPKGTLTAAQDWVRSEMRRCGVETFVCRTIEEIHTALDLWGIPVRLELSPLSRRG